SSAGRQVGCWMLECENRSGGTRLMIREFYNEDDESEYERFIIDGDVFVLNDFAGYRRPHQGPLSDHAHEALAVRWSAPHASRTMAGRAIYFPTMRRKTSWRTRTFTR